MSRFSPTLAAMVVVVSVASCTFESQVDSRVLLSVTSEVSVDQVTVLAATADDVIFQETVQVDPGRDLDVEPLGISLDVFLGLESPLDLQVSGYRDGALVAIHHAPFTIPDGGVMTVHLTAIAAECDADGDGTLDCTIEGCCDDAPVPEVFTDCAPGDDAVGPGVEEACNGIDDDCDDQIDEFACLDPTDVLVDVPPLTDTTLTDTTLTDLGPVEEVIAPEDTTPDVDPVEDVIPDVPPVEDTTPDVDPVEDVIPDVPPVEDVTPDVDPIEDVENEDVDADGATPPCTPDCDDLDCGDDGCGGSCGACDDGALCTDGQCVVCTPDCAGRDCGGDGCGGSCGECGDDAACSYWGQCEVTCAGNCSCDVLCGSVTKCHVDNCLDANDACFATDCVDILFCLQECGQDEGCQAACIDAAPAEDLAVFEEIGACLHTYCAPDVLKTCDTTCDGVDDDCDGVVDDDYASVETTCGEDDCVAAGVTNCTDGEVMDTCAAGDGSAELCDFIDNDCDGLTDQGEVCTGDYTLVSSGDFTMGSPLEEMCREEGEVAHEVTLTHSFFIKTTEVTQAEWTAVVGDNPSTHEPGCANCPVETLSWWEALVYCNALSVAEGLPECYALTDCSEQSFGLQCGGVEPVSLDGTVYGCEGYRLPTEAEWEYAARAGTITATYAGDLDSCSSSSEVLDPIAWYAANAEDTTHPVAGKAPNPWGLYDTLGGVWEWCWDDEQAYGSSAVTNPGGATVQSMKKVFRGGSLTNVPDRVRAAERVATGPTQRFHNLGLRPVRTVPSPDDCDTCVEGETCTDGVCEPCVPDCTDKACGDDGCGGSCGLCFKSTSAPWTYDCVEGACTDVCDPLCDGPDCDTTCDDIDQDCDLAVDDDYVSEATTCGEGACAAVGVTGCAIGNLLDSCEAGEPALEDLCGDDVDNDCDGVTDGSVGDLNQDGDAFWSSCDCNDEAADVYPGVAELCDGKDDDCDGLTDEDFKSDGLVAYTDLDGTTGLVLTDACGVGACAGGEVQCTPDGFSLHCTTYESAIKELCDGLDNDCDGATDEEMACYALIHPVTFTMGSPPDEACRDADETQHEVTLTRSYWLKTTEVTQGEWSALMGNEPSDESPGCDSCPVENVSWWEALAYSNALSIAEGLTPCYTLDGCFGQPGMAFYQCLDVEVAGSPYDCQGYRLPTEAEWEWAARAGTTWATYEGDLSEEDCEGVPEVLEPIAWYRENSGDTTQPVAGKAPNPWGLYDMLGNVWEWTWDARGSFEDYAAGPAQDPTGGGGGFGSGLRVWRGCAWDQYAKRCRSANRGEGEPNDRESDVGFRIARTVQWPDDFPDGDSIGAGDNCPFVSNEDQENLDGDDYGAACECDDTSPDIYPAADEICNGVDDDCDGQTDEAAMDCVDYYSDVDGDGVGDSAESQCLCWPTDAYPVFLSGDCDSDDPLVFPQADEDACNGVDDDCDDSTDEEFKDGSITYIDYDGAEDLVLEDPCGQGVCVSGEVVCSADGEDLACSTDDLITEEVCDDLDNDCDGTTDEGCVDADNDGVLDFKEPPGCLGTPADATVTTVGCMVGDATQDGCISQAEIDLFNGYYGIGTLPPVAECPLKGSDDLILGADELAEVLINASKLDDCVPTITVCETGCAAFLCHSQSCGPDVCGASCGGCPEGLGCVEGECTCDPICQAGATCNAGVCEPQVWGPDCSAIHAAHLAWPDGTYLIDPDGDGGDAPFEVHCDMTTHGGGWTLVAVSSDDGQHTWTWNNRHYWDTTTTPIGSLDQRDRDFKSRAYHELPFESVLFVHSTPGAPDHQIWAQYDPGDGTQTFAAFIGSHGEHINYKTTPGIPMAAGTLTVDGTMCSTDLYINPCGLDGQAACANDDDTYGPAWSINGSEGCPLDDPAIRGGLGPRYPGSSLDFEYYKNYLNTEPGVGFGVGLDLNTGLIGSGDNHMAIYVRLARCGDGHVNEGEVCDDGNDVDDDGCNAACELSAPLCEVDLDTAPDGFVTIPAGTFTMGSPETEPCRGEPETQHPVMLTRSFWLKTTEVTQHEWYVMMLNDPSQQNTGSATHPVDSIDWHSALAYCNALSQSEDLPTCYTLTDCTGHPGEPGFTCAAVTLNGSPLDCEGYRLPTEAEWEYAARATTTEATYNGDIPPTDCLGVASVLDPIAWYADNSGATTHTVGGKEPNAWGLYDMLGNVWEWAWDSWDATDYDPAGAIDPIASGGSTRSVRGGSYYFGAKYARSAHRAAHEPGLVTGGLGLRVARTVPVCVTAVAAAD
jgi:formylglycine-generating enzyme required for sulfatase activity